MKRRDLVTELEKVGCRLLRHGSCHDIYHNPETGKILKDLTKKPE